MKNRFGIIMSVVVAAFVCWALLGVKGPDVNSYKYRIENSPPSLEVYYTNEIRQENGCIEFNAVKGDFDTPKTYKICSNNYVIQEQ